VAVFFLGWFGTTGRHVSLLAGSLPPEILPGWERHENSYVYEDDDVGVSTAFLFIFFFFCFALALVCLLVVVVVVVTRSRHSVRLGALSLALFCLLSLAMTR
jgi:hypothetical protein